MALLRSLLSLALASTAAVAADVAPKRVGIVCDFQRQENVVRAYAKDLGTAYTVVVVDTHGMSDARNLYTQLMGEQKVDLVVALPGENSVTTRELETQLNRLSIPTTSFEGLRETAMGLRKGETVSSTTRSMTR